MHIFIQENIIETVDSKLAVFCLGINMLIAILVLSSFAVKL